MVCLTSALDRAYVLCIITAPRAALLDGGSQRNSIQVLRRAATLLDTVASARRPLSLSEICDAVGLNKSTVFNILRTLVDLGYLSVDPDSRRYRLGPATLRLGSAFQESLDVSAIARRHMLELRDLTGETVSLHIRIGLHRVCIDRVTSEQPIRRVIELGAERPLHVGAVGFVLLTGFDQGSLNDYLSSTSLSDSSPVFGAPLNATELRARVMAAKAKGWAMALGESAVGIAAVAVPIWGHDGRVEAGLVVSGPSSRWTEEGIRRNLGVIRQFAKTISIGLGWQDAASSSAREAEDVSVT